MLWILLVATFLIWLLVVLLFSPRIEYRITAPLRVDGDEFLHVIQATCQASVHCHNAVKILTNGAQLYPAMRDDILHLRRALVRAAQRGLRVRVVVPGRHTDQRLVRLASRRMYGELLDAGVKIFEFRSAMTHVKALLVDGTWAVIGTTNVDNRSFEHNDEVNVAFRAAAVNARLRRDFESDLAVSDEVTCDGWGGRPLLEKLVGPACWILERQQ